MFHFRLQILTDLKIVRAVDHRHFLPLSSLQRPWPASLTITEAMAVRCSACGGWIKTTGGTHDCPGKPKQHADLSNDDGMVPILGAVRLAEDFMVCTSSGLPCYTHIGLINSIRPFLRRCCNRAWNRPMPLLGIFDGETQRHCISGRQIGSWGCY